MLLLIVNLQFRDDLRENFTARPEHDNVALTIADLKIVHLTVGEAQYTGVPGSLLRIVRRAVSVSDTA